ncbi:Hypothetical predicted protein [Podarcis lilfordi]|uniref:Uncharacterized protein n=1 Tax=Podarcis lilfordi TaxID=74358 RepID=A0AA35KXW3_9SAUR|nr:Hypothetical predicted protein [Podarcis lilfordi]
MKPSRACDQPRTTHRSTSDRIPKWGAKEVPRPFLVVCVCARAVLINSPLSAPPPSGTAPLLSGKRPARNQGEAAHCFRGRRRERSRAAPGSGRLLPGRGCERETEASCFSLLVAASALAEKEEEEPEGAAERRQASRQAARGGSTRQMLFHAVSLHRSPL